MNFNFKVIDALRFLRGFNNLVQSQFFCFSWGEKVCFSSKCSHHFNSLCNSFKMWVKIKTILKFTLENCVCQNWFFTTDYKHFSCFYSNVNFSRFKRNLREISDFHKFLLIVLIIPRLFGQNLVFNRVKIKRHFYFSLWLLDDRVQHYCSGESTECQSCSQLLHSALLSLTIRTLKNSSDLSLRRIFHLKN